jgi:hypothetical protein
LNRFETTGLITPLLASKTNSMISLRVPVYDPINLYALVGMVTKFQSPPKSPTKTNLALLLINCISVSTVLETLGEELYLISTTMYIIFRYVDDICREQT